MVHQTFGTAVETISKTLSTLRWSRRWLRRLGLQGSGNRTLLGLLESRSVSVVVRVFCFKGVQGLVSGLGRIGFRVSGFRQH